VTRLDNEPCAGASGEFDIKRADGLDDGVVRYVETTVILSEISLEDTVPQLLDFSGWEEFLFIRWCVEVSGDW
jgi:hypothetical protein